MFVLEESFRSCRTISTLHSEIVNHSQCLKSAWLDSVQGMVTERQLTVTALHTRTGRLEDFGTFNGKITKLDLSVGHQKQSA